jgi:hypothetical protein
MVHHFAKMHNGSTSPSSIEIATEKKVEEFISSSPARIASAPAAMMRSAQRIWQGKDKDTPNPIL